MAAAAGHCGRPEFRPGGLSSSVAKTTLVPSTIPKRLGPRTLGAHQPCAEMEQQWHQQWRVAGCRRAQRGWLYTIPSIPERFRCA